jgi:hypothetical protein
MPHSFNISINNDLPSTLKEVEDSILKNGGEFSGDTTSGEFSGKSILGMIKGEYQCLSDNQVKVTIVKKPFAASNGRIESEICGYFA